VPEATFLQNTISRRIVIMNIEFITRTAILLALTIVMQTVGRYIPLGPNSQFIVGPLVNACLLIGAAATGIYGGAIIALAAPFGAILTGAAIPLPFAPFIAIGNFILVLFFYLLRKNKIAGILSGAMLKFGFLFASVHVFVRMMNLPAKKADAMILSFGWPQLVTALIGGAIALVVIRALGKNLEMPVKLKD
jgi:hypothetical protein